MRSGSRSAAAPSLAAIVGRARPDSPGIGGRTGQRRSDPLPCAGVPLPPRRRSCHSCWRARPRGGCRGLRDPVARRPPARSARHAELLPRRLVARRRHRRRGAHRQLGRGRRRAARQPARARRRPRAGHAHRHRHARRRRDRDRPRALGRAGHRAVDLRDQDRALPPGPALAGPVAPDGHPPTADRDEPAPGDRARRSSARADPRPRRRAADQRTPGRERRHRSREGPRHRRDGCRSGRVLHVNAADLAGATRRAGPKQFVEATDAARRRVSAAGPAAVGDPGRADGEGHRAARPEPLVRARRCWGASRPPRPSRSQPRTAPSRPATRSASGAWRPATSAGSRGRRRGASSSAGAASPR